MGGENKIFQHVRQSVADRYKEDTAYTNYIGFIDSGYDFNYIMARGKQYGPTKENIDNIIAENLSNPSRFWDVYVPSYENIIDTTGRFVIIDNGENPAAFLVSGYGNTVTVNFRQNPSDSAKIFFYDNNVLMSFDNGFYLTSNAGNWATKLYYTDNPETDAKSFIDFVPVSSGQYRILFNNGTSYLRYLYHTPDRNETSDAGTTPSGAGYEFNIQTATTLPIMFYANLKGFATMCLPVHVEIPSDIKVFLFEDLYQTVELVNVNTRIVPANTPVILYFDGITSDTQVDVTIVSTDYARKNIVRSENDKYKTRNTLTGTLNTMTDTGYNYVVSNVNGQIKFTENTESTLKGFNVYLEWASPKATSFVFK
jgi:hypothetical protein